MVSTYGLTESCGGIAYDGRLFDDTSARIDASGGVQLHGPTMMEGYRNDPAATAVAFTLDGWLRTGDTGALEPDGRLRIDGRSDEAIRTGAETVWPHEVEDALRDHPKVAEVAVAGRPHEEWGQQVVAFVVPVSGDDPPSLEELRLHGAERIARFKLPRSVVAMSELPRTASGKIRRASLPGDGRRRMVVLGRDEGPSPGGVGSGLRSCGDHRGVVIPRCGYRCRGVRIRVFGASSGTELIPPNG